VGAPIGEAEGDFVGTAIGNALGARVGVEVSMLRLYFWISVTSVSKFEGRDPHGLACYVYITTEREGVYAVK
jgi:hypothetical protein